MLLAALATSRFVHYAACILIFGLSLYGFYAPRRGRGWLIASAVAALASGVAWLLLVTANLAGALDLAALRTVVVELPFGQIWAVRLALAAAAIALVGRPRTSLVLSALLLASIALTGHTQTHEGGARLIHEIADAAHLLGAGAWLGGLMGLTLMLRKPARPDLAEVIGRFSRMAYVAVAAIVASGLINAWLLLGSPFNLFASPYGWLLTAKLVLFAAMLALAAINRLVISPRLSGDGGQAARLGRHVLIEQGLGLAVLACVACLGLGQPPL